MSNCNDISACRKCAQAVSSAAFWTRGSECISKKSLFLQRQNIGVLFGFFCTNTILKLIQNIFSTLALLAHALHRVKKKRKKKRRKKKKAINRVTPSFNIHQQSGSILSTPVFISRSAGQKQKYEGAGLQEGNPWQPDIKMVQESSRTSQVARGQTKVRERGGKEQVILKS